MVNNLELIKSLLTFNSEDEFYFVQIIVRKKDNPGTKGSNNSARVVKAYYISSVESLDAQFPEMIALADLHNARVGINLNKRSFEKTAFHTLKKVTDQLLNKDYKSVRKAYNSVCGMYTIRDKLWLIDIDDHEYDPTDLLVHLETLQPIGPKLFARVPTKNGYHLITKPFNASTFTGFNLHHNNPTILYIP